MHATKLGLSLCAQHHLVQAELRMADIRLASWAENEVVWAPVALHKAFRDDGPIIHLVVAEVQQDAV